MRGPQVALPPKRTGKRRAREKRTGHAPGMAATVRTVAAAPTEAATVVTVQEGIMEKRPKRKCKEVPPGTYAPIKRAKGTPPGRPPDVDPPLNPPTPNNPIPPLP